MTANLTDSYLTILKLMKYSVQPYDYKMREWSDYNDILKAGLKTFLPNMPYA